MDISTLRQPLHRPFLPAVDHHLVVSFRISQHFIKFLFPGEEIRLGFILQPQLFPGLIKGDHRFADQLTGRVVLLGYSSPDEDFVLLGKILLVLLIISGEYHHFHRPRQILNGEEGHGLIVLGIFNSLPGDDPADSLLDAVVDSGPPGLFIQLEIQSSAGDPFPPPLFILLHGMAA